MACDCKYFKCIQRPIFIISNLSCKNYIYMYKFTYNLHWKFLAFTVTYMYEWINSCICTYFRQLKRFYFNCCIFKYMHVCFIFRAVKLLLCNHAVHLKVEQHPHMISILSHPSQSSSCYLYISLCQVEIL